MISPSIQEALNESRSLLVMAALAAGNHSLPDHAGTLMEAFPWLIRSKELRSVCHALVLHGLFQTDRALEYLSECHSKPACTLREVLNAPARHLL